MTPSLQGGVVSEPEYLNESAYHILLSFGLSDLRLELASLEKRDNLGHFEWLGVGSLAQGSNLIHRVEDGGSDGGSLSLGGLAILAGRLASGSLGFVGSVGEAVVEIDVESNHGEFLVFALVDHVHLHGHAGAVVEMLAGEMEVELL